MASRKRYVFSKQGGALVPQDDQAKEWLAEQENGKPLWIDAAQCRNYKLLKKAHALINLSFDYWCPSTMVTSVEIQTVQKLRKFMVQQHGIDADASKEFCAQFLRGLEDARSDVEVGKSREAFRDHMTVEAGYYELVQTPIGPRKSPKSWAYSSMTEDTFRDFYRALFGACWRLVMQNHFENEEAAEQAVNALTGME